MEIICNSGIIFFWTPPKVECISPSNQAELKERFHAKTYCPLESSKGYANTNGHLMLFSALCGLHIKPKTCLSFLKSSMQTTNLNVYSLYSFLEPYQC